MYLIAVNTSFDRDIRIIGKFSWGIKKNEVRCVKEGPSEKAFENLSKGLKCHQINVKVKYPKHFCDSEPFTDATRCDSKSEIL